MVADGRCRNYEREEPAALWSPIIHIGTEGGILQVFQVVEEDYLCDRVLGQDLSSRDFQVRPLP